MVILRRNWQFAILLLLSFAVDSPLFAAPPVFTSITPPGAQRGKAIEITTGGSGLTPQTRLLLPFQATQKYLADAKPNPAQARFQLTVDPAVPLGIYPIRVMTEEGVSGIVF